MCYLCCCCLLREGTAVCWCLSLFVACSFVYCYLLVVCVFVVLCCFCFVLFVVICLVLFMLSCVCVVACVAAFCLRLNMLLFMRV